MKTPQQAAQAWTNSAGAAAANFQQGVEGFQGDWAGATTSQGAAYINGVQQAYSSGRWAAGVNRTGTNGWKSQTVAKLANYSVGFNAGASRFQSAIAKVISAEQNIVAGLPPRGSLQQNLARANAFATQMNALKGTLSA